MIRGRPLSNCSVFIACCVIVHLMEGCSSYGRDDDALPPMAAGVVGGLPESLENSIGMRFHYVEAGSFIMGSQSRDGIPEAFAAMEEPRRTQLEHGYYMGTTEVTNAEYLAFVRVTGYRGGSQGEKDFLRHMNDPEYLDFRRPDQPVMFVSRYDAEAFCAWLYKKEGVCYRLPTEVEWEYACKASEDSGKRVVEREALAGRAWYEANASGRTHRVAKLSSNPWGFYDMLGNVWEWTVSYIPTKSLEDSEWEEPIAMIRGGSAANSASGSRCSARWAGWPADKRSEYVGFRIVRLPSGEQKCR